MIRLLTSIIITLLENDITNNQITFTTALKKKHLTLRTIGFKLNNISIKKQIVNNNVFKNIAKNCYQ